MSYASKVDELKLDELKLSVSPALIEPPDEALFKGRTYVRLPVGIHEKEWKEIGITWLEKLDKRQMLTQAILPEGWSSNQIISDRETLIHPAILFDKEGIPRVTVHVNIDYGSLRDDYAYAIFLTNAQSEQILRTLKKS